MEIAKSLRDEKDRISSLPDCLLHLIMSFLTAHRAVRTCVLSKRWKNVWTTLPFLNFDMYGFENDTLLDNTESEDDEERFRRFTNFVNMTLLHREASDLHRFRLSCADMPGHLHNMFKRSWIRYVIKHNPRVIDIKIAIRDSLPLDVLSCASLVDLSLCFESVYIPRSDQYQNNIVVVNLPFLRRLHLQSIFLSQDFMDKLFCGCPMLEFLHLLRHCSCDFSSISSQSLKHLKLEYYCSFDRTNKLELIDTPNLLSFNYRRCVNYIGHKMLMNMPSLTTASIFLDGCCCGPYNGKSNIFTGISSVESLELGGSFMKDIFRNELLTCPEFQNVKDLSVESLCLRCHFNLLASFLDNNPNVKKLSLYHYHSGSNCELPTCSEFPNVKDLYVRGLCLNCHFNLLASCLDHFPNLKKLSLCLLGPMFISSCKCQEEVDINQEPLKITPFRCEQLETVDVIFNIHDKHVHWVMKYLQDATEGLQARIKMISW